VQARLADGLDRKRANEAARSLPVSARALGPAFRRSFLAYARGSRLGAGTMRYRDDAIAFARRADAGALVSFEGALLERSRREATLVRVGLYACDLRATFRTMRVVPGYTLAVWLAGRSGPLLVAMPFAARNEARGPGRPR
jgi:hypothetical protein